MFLLNHYHLALVRLLRDGLPFSDYIPESSPSVVASVPSWGPGFRVNVRFECSIAVDRRVVYLVGPVAGE